jgi:mannosyltransferase OCH1-like enzyme
MSLMFTSYQYYNRQFNGRNNDEGNHNKTTNKKKNKVKVKDKNKPSNDLIPCSELFNSIDSDKTTININIIPKYVFQTLKEKKMYPDMKTNALKLREQNKDFTFYLYDDDMCREFIKKHFNDEVLHAFDTLIPGPFKADLWRYCILYIYGGVYMDIKLNCINGFRLKNILHEECYPRDIHHRQKGIWQGFLISKPNNELFNKCIQVICMHVKFKFYGSTFLSVTGPHLMYNIMSKYNKRFYYDISKMKLIKKNFKVYLYYNNKPVLNFYNTWEDDKKKMGVRYSVLWRQRKIYKS